ncbi:MAG TPA: prolipoprotein diacylglyceryl transferase family protein [Candidatus Limnocylindria bacterium]|nr:prolipoprotein diacylglyceryl transferase family protein [Candidatus Limnocylindria bacterium]
MRSAVSRHAVARPATTRNGDTRAAGGSWVDGLLQEILTATYWFDPGDEGEPYSTTIRFRGRRTRVNGKPSTRDSFVKDETIDGVIPGSGPTAVTTRVSGINPGRWIVTAEPLARGSVRAKPRPTGGVEGLQRPWPWVSVRPTDATLLKTAVAPLARVPGVIPGAYTALVALGMLVGLATLLAIVGSVGITQGPVLVASLTALFVGLIGGKSLYVAQQRGKRFEGWCIQGFVVGTAVAGTVALLFLRLPVGVVLNASAPALFLGIAVGRPGCFVAGCCGGRPTAARWALWCSDQRIGTRRIPTQLIESLLALVIGAATLFLFLQVRPLLPGALFVGAVAAYALGRQFILPLRSDPRLRSSTGRLVTVTVAALVLGADVLLSTAI